MPHAKEMKAKLVQRAGRVLVMVSFIVMETLYYKM